MSFKFPKKAVVCNGIAYNSYRAYENIEIK